MDNQEENFHDQDLLNFQRRKTVPKFVLEEFVKVDGEDSDGGSLDSNKDEEEKQKDPSPMPLDMQNSLTSPLKLTKRKSSFYKTRSVVHVDCDFDKVKEHDQDHAGLQTECPIQEKLGSPSNSDSSKNSKNTVENTEGL